jgi:UDP-N-acetylmuramoylalanine--D-glutamate ligase
MFLHSQGAKVAVSDSKAPAELGDTIPRLLDLGITVETGTHGERTFRDQDLIVVSPGVPVNAPQLELARGYGIQVIGEVELASQYLKGRTIAITGSNGKTTTTSLVGEVLAKSGLKTQVGGNIGTPVTDLIATSTPETWNVLEISSFQMETIVHFRPKIASILNITPDHLDRHGDFATYAAMKARVFENQTADDVAVLNYDDATCRDIGGKVKSRVVWFGQKERAPHGAFVRAAAIYYREASGEEREILKLADIPLKGAHNVDNVLAAVCIGLAAGCKPEDIARGVREFKAVEHRLEHVATIDGVAYYNDSKATNVDATIKALESFPKGIHLILGGKDKGSDYSVLNDLIRERCARVYTIGAAAEKIQAQLDRSLPVTHSETLDKAVRQASENAKEGHIVLLAPACASFDQFKSYEHRGRVFKELVQKIAAEREAETSQRSQNG